ncbi:MAG: helix-turn-helix transcriptional regulator [Flavobacteriia bacterium]|nr:helix-turn-helix transcriptional regulator [Flavobacteriia bacterium]
MKVHFMIISLQKTVRFYIVIILIMVHNNLFGNSNPIRFCTQIKQDPPKEISVFVNYYAPIPDRNQIDKNYEIIQRKLKSNRLHLLNELAYIATIIRRANTEKSFIMLQQLNEQIKKQDKYIQGIYYTVYARLLYNVKKLDLAIKNNLKSIELLRQTTSKGDLKKAFINQGFYLASIHKNKALTYYKLALKLEKEGVEEGEIVLRTNLAYSALLNSDTKQALMFCNEALEKVKQVKVYNFMDEYRVLIILASIHFENGNLEKSNFYLQKAKDISIHYNMLDIRKEIDYSQSYRAVMKNDYQTAYHLLYEADSLSKLVAVEKIREGIAVYDLEYKIKEAKKEKIRIQKIVAIQQREKHILIVSLSIITLAFIGITLLLLQIRTKNKVLVQQNLRFAKADIQRVKPELHETEIKDVSLQLIFELEKLIYDKKWYEKSNLTLEKLAKKLGTNRTYLSEAINQHYKENYSTWINAIRINASLKLLASQEYDHYSIDGIAKMVGYSSISSFNATFKKTTGLTPSQFKKTRD